MIDYRTLFEVADVVKFTNSDMPTWGRGLWKVVRVSRFSVHLSPVLESREPDPERKRARIVGGGLIGQR